MFDRIFYILLNYYSRGTSHRKNNPLVTVFSILVIVLFCLNLLGVEIFESLSSGGNARLRYSQQGIWMVCLICATIVYFGYVFNKRYIQVYWRFRSDRFLNSNSGRWFYWILIVLIILSPFIFAMVKNKILLGRWA